MARDNAPTWEKIEEQAFHAYREWPIWLALRGRELAAHLQQNQSPARAPSAARTGAGHQSATETKGQTA